MIRRSYKVGFIHGAKADYVMDNLKKETARQIVDALKANGCGNAFVGVDIKKI